MSRRTARPSLTTEQRAEAQRIRRAVLDAAPEDLDELAELLASGDDASTFGATEFAARDIVLRVGAEAIEAALSGRKKGGTTGPAAPAPTAAGPPSSSDTGASPSRRFSVAFGSVGPTTTAPTAAGGTARATARRVRRRPT